MPKSGEKRKPVSPEIKAKNLLKRFPIVDLSYAVSLSGSERQRFLKRFVQTFTTLSYRPTREACAMVYGAQKPLFETAPDSWDAVENHLRTTARKDLVDMNINAAKHLYELVRPMGYLATECDEQVLRVRLKQIVNIELNFYITDRSRLIFQFPQLRQAYLDEKSIIVLGSIIHHAYAQGDFSSAEIEIADIGRLPKEDARFPRIRQVPRAAILDRNALTENIEEVYEALRLISDQLPEEAP